MKLNLVADYDVRGKRLVTTWAIDGSLNLAELQDLTKIGFPTTDGGMVWLAPVSLTMCESLRKADKVKEAWDVGYKARGCYYDYKPISRNESEAAK